MLATPEYTQFFPESSADLVREFGAQILHTVSM